MFNANKCYWSIPGSQVFTFLKAWTFFLDSGYLEVWMREKNELTKQFKKMYNTFSGHIERSTECLKIHSLEETTLIV